MPVLTCPILPPRSLCFAALTALTALACAATPGTTEDPVPPDEPIVLRPLSPEALARKAIAYSGYRTGQSPEIQKFPSKQEIAEDLRLLARGGWTFLRLFDAGPHAERVLQVIDEGGLDMRVMLGIWISGAKAKHDPINRAEIDRAVTLARAHERTVVAVSVGNEALDDWSSVRLPPAELAGYIRQVRSRVSQPVTTDDSWLPFVFGQDGATSYAEVVQVVRAVDFLAVHVYAFADAYYGGWNWKQESVPEDKRARTMMDAAMAYTKASLARVRAAIRERGLDRPIVVGEAGWKDTTRFTAADAPEDAIEIHLAHPVNQKMFHDDLTGWVYGATKDADSPLAAFYFEAFDEPWKGAWGDDNWGLFDVNRRPKHVIRSAFPDLQPAHAMTYAEADAVYYGKP